MSKILLLSKPLKINGFCDNCMKETEQIVAFIRYEATKHTVLYHHKCLSCKSKGEFKANIKFWVSEIVKINRLDEN